jgi:hypothetical protein
MNGTCDMKVWGIQSQKHGLNNDDPKYPADHRKEVAKMRYEAESGFGNPGRSPV